MQREGANHRSALKHLFETAGETHKKKIRKTTRVKDLHVTISFYEAVSSGLTAESFQQIKCFQAQVITVLLPIFWTLHVKCRAMKRPLVREWLMVAALHD